MTLISPIHQDKSGSTLFALRRVFAIALLAALAGCASMSAEECRSANWSQIGVKDGLDMRAESYINEHAESCSKEHIAVDRSAWRQGWEQGKRQFCTPGNAQLKAAQGFEYKGGCPSDLEAAFLQAYQPARDKYEMDQLYRRLDDKTRELARAVSDRSAASPNTTKAERDRLDAKVTALSAEVERLRFEIRNRTLGGMFKR